MGVISNMKFPKFYEEIKYLISDLIQIPDNIYVRQGDKLFDISNIVMKYEDLDTIVLEIEEQSRD